MSTDSQRTVCSIYLSLLRFSSIAIELKVDGQRALIFKQCLNEFINKEMADVVHEFIDHPSYLTLTFQHRVSPQDPSLRARGTCIRRTACLVYGNLTYSVHTVNNLPLFNYQSETLVYFCK